jgi:2-hydroxychromene-2-carboxylate isomerase
VAGHDQGAQHPRAVVGRGTPAVTIACDVALNGPWTHPGATRIAALAARRGAALRVFPVEFGQVIFPASGGLPERSPHRQAERMQALRRWRAASSARRAA